LTKKDSIKQVANDTCKSVRKSALIQRKQKLISRFVFVGTSKWKWRYELESPQFSGAWCRTERSRRPYEANHDGWLKVQQAYCPVYEIRDC